MKKLFYLAVIMLPLSIVSCSKKDSNGEESNSDSGKIKAVDLGLSVKWASANVGASSPWDFGDYYAWGETTPKSDYSTNNYKWYDSYNQYDNYWAVSWIFKYCCSLYNSIKGAVDMKTVLDPEDDVAHVKLGGKWRMPTKDEMYELVFTRYKANYEWTWNKGWTITFLENGNSIFLPASGFIDGTWIREVGTGGYCYWTSSLDEDYSEDAYVLGFNTSGVEVNYMPRREGRSIRAVCD